ncbi:MAG: hypothetical protein AB7U18_22735, partial [Dehalococcoidia bacterium]
MSVAAIFEAVRENDAERVARLVREEPALSRARNEDGLSVVLLARYTRKLEALASLLAAGGTLVVFEAAAVGDGERLRV